MDYLGDDKKLENLDKENWDFIEISKINEKIIKELIDNLKLDLSDEFFISFESLLKLGNKAESAIKSVINEIDDSHKFKKEIFNFLLNSIKAHEIKNPLILKLYHPDFTVRARAIKQIEKNKDLKYLEFILPLINDPDDSCRWAVINLLISLNQIKNPKIFKKLKNHINFESNLIIRKKLKEITKDI